MLSYASADVPSGIQPTYLILAGAVLVLLLVTLLMRVHRTRTKPQTAVRSRAGSAIEDPFAGVLLSSLPQRDLHNAAKTTAWSVFVHACVVAALLWATTSTNGRGNADDQPTELTMHVVEPTPPLPTPVPPPPTPSSVDVPFGFQTLTMPTIVPPNIPPPQFGNPTIEADWLGRGREGGRHDGRPGAPPTQSDVYAGPTFIPRTVEPELKNTEEVQRVLARTYPPLLRDSGIGGKVLLWLLIDETGKVVKTQVKESSGQPQLDEAAERVAAVMDFVPAKNREHNVTVWVAIPIAFTTR